MTDSPTPASLAAVFGGGGLFGIAFGLGIAEALLDEGVPIDEAPTLGTSAGSWVTAGISLGVRFTDAVDLLGDTAPRVPDPRPGRLRAVACALFGEDTRCPAVLTSVCTVPRFRRVVLSGADHPISDLVAASSAVPGLLAPQRVGGRLYVDGGVRSMASIDKAPDASRLLAVLPLSAPMFGPAGRVIERAISREMRIWTDAHPGASTVVVRPSAEIARLARRPDQLFSRDRALRCYDLAYADGVALLDRWSIDG
jgi:predicted acylesterase/phospholipase RssA